MKKRVKDMPFSSVLFVGSAAVAVVGLNLIRTPRAFRTVVIGFGIGLTFGGIVSFGNRLRNHSLDAVTIPLEPLGVSTKFPKNYREISPVIYKGLKDDYEERGELDKGEEHITVQPGVFAQIGVLDVDGTRHMWYSAVLPTLRALHASLPLQNSSGSSKDLESKIVFCDIGSGVGNICLQVLAETHCEKAVGIEVIPSRVRASKEATTRAHEFYPEVFKGKEAIWVEANVLNSAAILSQENVNVIFTHSWMFDDELMTELTKIIAAVPSVECVVTSRRLNERNLSGSSLKLQSLYHFSADWNDEAPFYIYAKERA